MKVKKAVLLASVIPIAMEQQQKTSSFNLNKMQGHLGLNGKIHMQKDSVVIDNQVQFNHKALAGGQGAAFRTEVALSPTGTMQKVANIAITGGAMRHAFRITPR